MSIIEPTYYKYEPEGFRYHVASRKAYAPEVHRTKSTPIKIPERADPAKRIRYRVPQRNNPMVILPPAGRNPDREALDEELDIKRHGIKVQLADKNLNALDITGDMKSISNQIRDAQAGNLVTLTNLAAKLDDLTQAQFDSVQKVIEGLGISSSRKDAKFNEWYTFQDIKDAKNSTTIRIFLQANVKPPRTDQRPVIGVSGTPVTWRTAMSKLAKKKHILNMDMTQIMSITQAMKQYGYVPSSAPASSAPAPVVGPGAIGLADLFNQR